MPLALLLLIDVALVLALSRALRGLLGRVGQPPVMAEVLAGILLGATVLGAFGGDPVGALFPADARDALSLAGQVALVGYVFAVGARFEPGALRAEGRAAGLVAVAAFAVPWVAGLGLGVALHGFVQTDASRGAFALFVAAALAVTAFPVLARIVDERGLRDRPAGRVALAAAGAQELLVWPALAIALAVAAGAGAPVAVLRDGAIALAGVLLLARVVVPKAASAVAGLRRAGAHGPQGAPRPGGVVVLAGLAVSAWATDAAGLHALLGAFAFGVALPPAARAAGTGLLAARPLVVASAVLLPLAFAIPALRVDVGALGGDGVLLLAVLVVVAVAAKLVPARLAARAGGLDPAEAADVGVLMTARGLVELVVLGAGLEAGLLDERLFTAFVLMALVTTFAAGPLLGRTGGRRRTATRPRSKLVVDG